MSTLPTGTVTFLFTDIEGSTKLAREYPETWDASQEQHYAILYEAVEANGGYVFQTIGDAVCAAFHNAGDALHAAIKGQQDLQNKEWGLYTVRVRMGIHSGQAEFKKNNYHGYLALSLVQRIMSAGHGGQVLLSGATENLLRGQIHPGIELVDRGRHTFKDVSQAVRVFQVVAPGLPEDFPPLRAFNILPNNLPTQLTSFIGREKELGDVKRLLHDTHLLTLIGPGGTGKTRLSLQVANDVLAQYPDGVWLVDLAPVLDPQLVPRTTSIAIGLRDEPQRPVIDMLCDYLSKKKMLIILDNCEHLVDACAQLVDRILHAAADVRILTGSREALGIAGEVTYRVPSLGLPDVDNLPVLESLNQYEAVRLFIDRAISAIPDFKVTNDNAPALAQVCHRLDGIPLAIELAAAKIRVLSVEQIANRLDDRFRLLTGGSRTALERHQTLRAAVDWSYNLLPSEEQILFRRLAVFVGGWTLEAAESVCGVDSGSSVIRSEDILDLMEHLINKSLVQREKKGGESRFRMLETMHQYANEKLVEAGESGVLRGRHLEYFLDLAETAAPHLIKPEQLEWLPLLDADYDNLRLAFEYSLGQEKSESALNFCVALWRLWEIRGYWQEGLNWLKKSLAMPFSKEDRSALISRVRALYTCAQFEWHLGYMEEMQSPAEESLALAMEISDRKDVAIARYYAGAALMLSRKDNDKARKLVEQSFADFQNLNEPFWAAMTYVAVGTLLGNQDKITWSEYSSKRLELARDTDDRLSLADALTECVWSLLDAGQVDKAAEYIKEADGLYEQLGAESNSLSLLLFAEIARDKGNFEEAESLFKEMQEHLQLLGEKFFREICLSNLGRLAIEAGKLNDAQEYLEESLVLAKEVGFKPRIAWAFADLGNLFYLQGDYIAFKKNVNQSLSFKDSFTNLNKAQILSIFLLTISFRNPASAALIVGSIDSFQREIDEPFWREYKHFYNRAKAHILEVLGNDVFYAALAEGQKMSLDEALELVLEIVEDME